MSTALAAIESITAVDFFKPGASTSIIESLKKEARAIASALDVSKPSDRDTMRSLAAKLGKTKTRLDSAGKELVAGWKQQAKAVDIERATVWDEVEALQKEVRQPLTDWENAEKDRVAGHEAAIAAIPEHPMWGPQETSADIEQRLQYLSTVYQSRDWQEFSSRAKLALDQEISRAKNVLEGVQKREQEASELSRLRAEAAEREQKERDERIAREAKEAAERAAEVRAQEQARLAEVERQRVEREKFEAEARAKAAETAGLEAERRHAEQLEEAEAERIAAAQRAEQRAVEAQEAAVAAERQRAEQAAEAERAATEARERNKAHATKINREVRDGLMAYVSEVQATAIVKAIASGIIPHAKITY